ncbi:MAG: dephospho-CoA kinase [Lachnospiraceae bacterium]|nr:dephospho-CoA kinase [Lachnospiraceae bacterium]
MRLIGVTGGVGAGKSEILSYIKKHYKCRIYLADEVAHLIKRKGERCYDRLVDLLGEEVLEESGEIDKKKMAAAIFASEELLEQVNAIVHPEVRFYLEDRIKEAWKDESVELLFIEAALLIEAGYGEIVDEMWYIYADEDVRRKRLKANRGYSEEKIEQIMEAQLSEEEFRAACDFVINNSGELSESYKQINEKLEAFTWLE